MPNSYTLSVIISFADQALARAFQPFEEHLE